MWVLYQASNSSQRELSLTFDPETAMSSSVLMATQVISWSCPQRTCTGLGDRPLEKPPWRTTQPLLWWAAYSFVHVYKHVSEPRWLPVVEPATRYRMCPLNQRWGRCHRDPVPNRWQRLCRTQKTPTNKYVALQQSTYMYICCNLDIRH